MTIPRTYSLDSPDCASTLNAHVLIYFSTSVVCHHWIVFIHFESHFIIPFKINFIVPTSQASYWLHFLLHITQVSRVVSVYYIQFFSCSYFNFNFSHFFKGKKWWPWWHVQGFIIQFHFIWFITRILRITFCAFKNIFLNLFFHSQLAILLVLLLVPSQYFFGWILFFSLSSNNKTPQLSVLVSFYFSVLALSNRLLSLKPSEVLSY